MKNSKFTKIFVIALFTITVQVITAYIIPEEKQGLSEVTNNIDEIHSLVSLEKVEGINY